MTGPLTVDELGEIVTSCPGLDVDIARLVDAPHKSFDELGVDSSGVLVVIAELERRFGMPLGRYARSAPPRAG